MIKEKNIPNMDWFDQLFKNIKILHLAGVAHNDLHCKNIVGDEALLIDFGLARISKTDIDEDTGTFLIFINNFFINFLYIFSEGIISEPNGSLP
jgi:tRNA A-37 threonylcarbamoyl transferase component Bud32